MCNGTTLSGVTRRTGVPDLLVVERRVTFDRAVRTKPLASAADAARQLCLFNRTVHGVGAYAGSSDTPIKTVMARARSVSAAREGIEISGRTDLGARAYRRAATIAAWRGEGIGLRRVIEDARQERVEEKLPRRQPFDEAHGRTTPRARPRRA